MPVQNKQRTAIMQMVACSSLWSIAGIFIKLIDWNPFVIAGFRSLFAVMAETIYILATKQKIIINKNVLISMVFMTANSLCFISANKLTTAANAIVLQFTAPVFIVIFSVLFLRQKFKLSDLVTVFFTVVGMSIFFYSSLGKGQILGNALAVCNGVFTAGVYLMIGKTAKNEKMSCIVLGHSLTACIGIPFYFFTEGTISAVSVSAIIILGIFQLGIPYILYGLASVNCPPLACSLISAIEPLLNPVWVFLFNGEHPGALSIIGGMIVITAVTVQCILQDRQARINVKEQPSYPV